MLFVKQDARAQTIYPWYFGLQQTAVNGYQYSSANYHLVTKVKYSSRGIRTAIANILYYYPNPNITINQLDRTDYMRWRGMQSMLLLRDNPAPDGFNQTYYFGSSSSNYAVDFETDPDDNYIVACDNKGDGWDPLKLVSSKREDSTQLLLMKMDKTGKNIWYKLYGGSSAEFAVAIRKAGDGNYIVLAQTQSNDGDVTNAQGGKDIWLLKIRDSDGSIIWKKTIGSAVDELPTDLEILPNGSMIISGSADVSPFLPGPAGRNSFLMQLDNSGNMMWSKTYGGSGDDLLRAFTLVPTGGMVSIHTTNSSDGDFPINNGGSDVYVCRHDAAGNIIWKKQYGNADNDLAGDVAFSMCDSTTFASWSKQYNGAPRPDFPPFSQAVGVRVKLSKNGVENYYYQESFTFPVFINWSQAFNDHIISSMIANDRGGILIGQNSHMKWDGASAPVNDRGNVVRTFDMYEYGVILNKAAKDTTICSGQSAWGHTFTRDSTFSDTLRNHCQIDTLLTTYKVHVLNADSSIVKDTTLCYGALYDGAPVYNSFIKKDTVLAMTICGQKKIIKSTSVKVAPKALAFGKDTLLCHQQPFLLKAYTRARSWLWQDNSTNATLSATAAGLYWVAVTDTFGCVTRDSINISRTSLYLNVVSPVTMVYPTPVTLSAQSNGNITWQAAPGLGCTLCNDPVANPQETTTYLLSSAKDNCTVNASVLVNVQKTVYVYLPKAFTPNGNSTNDLFRVQTNIMADFTLDIFNRYGQILYHGEALQRGWDGTYKGKQQPQGNYVYILRYHYKGHVEMEKGNILLLR